MVRNISFTLLNHQSVPRHKTFNMNLRLPLFLFTVTAVNCEEVTSEVGPIPEDVLLTFCTPVVDCDRQCNSKCFIDPCFGTSVVCCDPKNNMDGHDIGMEQQEPTSTFLRGYKK